ncbi:unnamed protein product, partial [Polarella glacialis]
AGNIATPLESQDRTKRPIMDPTLTIRSLLRFCELRHTANDDLRPADFVGKSGAGLKVLLRKVREYQKEVIEVLDSRVDDIVRMTRAFYDQ